MFPPSVQFSFPADQDQDHLLLSYFILSFPFPQQEKKWSIICMCIIYTLSSSQLASIFPSYCLMSVTAATLSLYATALTPRFQNKSTKTENDHRGHIFHLVTKTHHSRLCASRYYNRPNNSFIACLLYFLLPPSSLSLFLNRSPLTGEGDIVKHKKYWSLQCLDTILETILSHLWQSLQDTAILPF